MNQVLYIQASPRGARSKSIAVAEAFLDAYAGAQPDDEVNRLDLATADLPAFDGPAMEAKYAILRGQDRSDEQAEAWLAVESVIAEFKAADKYVIATPMWNFGLPYRLKHYLDLLIQPGYTFAYSPQTGYTGLVTGKPVFVAYARGGEYGPDSGMDFQKPHLECLLRFIGFEAIRSVVVEPTLMGGPDVAKTKLDAGIAEARQIAGSF